MGLIISSMNYFKLYDEKEENIIQFDNNSDDSYESDNSTESYKTLYNEDEFNNTLDNMIVENTENIIKRIRKY